MSKPETCVCCGRVIPENSHYCVICGKETESKENKVYEAIVDYINKHQRPPSVRNLCELTGITSTAVVHSKLKSLAEKGYIEIDIKSARGIKVKPKTNYDRIRGMSVEELTQFISTIAEHCYYDECKGCPIYNACGVCDCSDLHIRKYLESEVDTE